MPSRGDHDASKTYSTVQHSRLCLKNRVYLTPWDNRIIVGDVSGLLFTFGIAGISRDHKIRLHAVGNIGHVERDSVLYLGRQVLSEW